MRMKKFLFTAALLLTACEIEVRVPTVYVIDVVEDTTEDTATHGQGVLDTAEYCDNRTECSAVW